MIYKKIYDILELQKLEPSVLNALALSYGVDTANKKKQITIYELLKEQEKWCNTDSIGISQTPPSADKKRVYLVAKVSGLPEAEVIAKYAKARKIVESHGYEAVVPTDMLPIDTNWHYAMRLLIPVMLGCDAYTLVDDPWTTVGGMIEDTIANWVQLPKLMFSKL